MQCVSTFVFSFRHVSALCTAKPVVSLFCHSHLKIIRPCSCISSTKHGSVYLPGLPTRQCSCMIFGGSVVVVFLFLFFQGFHHLCRCQSYSQSASMFSFHVFRSECCVLWSVTAEIMRTLILYPARAGKLRSRLCFLGTGTVIPDTICPMGRLFSRGGGGGNKQRLSTKSAM